MTLKRSDQTTTTTTIKCIVWIDMEFVSIRSVETLETDSESNQNLIRQ